MFNSLYSFYRSDEWRRLRSVLMLERIDGNGDVICAECGKPITKAYDCIAHHVVPLNEANVNDYDVSLNPSNIELLHHACHNLRHKRFGTYTRHITIVYGSPCSGKTTFVNESATKDDIIIDIDRIFEAINNGRSNRLYPNVMQIHRMLLDMVKTRNGRWMNAWIVGGYPLKMDRERLANELGAETIHIDTPKEICEQRAFERGGGEYVKFVHDWFERYQA